MITENFFTETALHNNFIVGAPIRINQDNERYSWHRVVKVYQWLGAHADGRATILTVNLDQNFTEHLHHVWKEKDLLDAMQLVTLDEKERLGVKVAQWWEWDLLPEILEFPLVHIN